MKFNPKKILNKQKKIYRSLLIGGVFILIGISYLILRNPAYPIPSSQTAQVDLPADKINPQDIWMNRVDSQNQVLDQRLKYLENMILEKRTKEEEIEKDKRALKQEIHHLKNELNSISNSVEERKNLREADPFLHTPVIDEGTTSSTCIPIVEACMPSPPEAKVQHVERVIPSGTTVKALLLSSVDADCSVFSNGDPIPVKLRILDDGHLPENIDVKLKGGIIIGSAYGNISSERVYVRLERLTQVKSSGNFMETEVTGFVTGEDGKYGVRGTVVDKSGKIISSAAISGFFAETGAILQSLLGRYTVDNYLSTNQYSGDASMTPGAFNRASSSFDMLADYYIKRAEQVNPVIQVNAGRIVDITFTYGTEVGDLHTQDKVRNLRVTREEFP